jgi:hypothetical protein
VESHSCFHPCGCYVSALKFSAVFPPRGFLPAVFHPGALALLVLCIMHLFDLIFVYIVSRAQ